MGLLGKGAATAGGGGGLGQLNLGASLSQPSLGLAVGPTSTAPSTALPGTGATFNLQQPPLGKRKNNIVTG